MPPSPSQPIRPASQLERPRPAHRSHAAWPTVSVILLMAAVLYIPFVILSGHQQAPVGDLVRIGAWSERSYGWRQSQLAIPVRHNRADRDRATVWVLGDSFSMGNVWQSVWADVSGQPVYTQGYRGHACVQAFIDAALHQPQVQHVVVQTIERHLLDRFLHEGPCPAEGPEPYEGPPGVTATERPHWQGKGKGLAFDGQGFLGFWPLVDWRTLLRAAWNEHRTDPAEPMRIVTSGDTVNLPLAQRAPMSNLRSDRLLVYLGDDFKRTWKASELERAAARAAALQARVEAAGKRLTLLVVPDKSTVYRPFMRPADQMAMQPLAAIFERSGVAIDYPQADMAEAALRIPDFYLPDDTHLSPAGFAWLGRHMAR